MTERIWKPIINNSLCTSCHACHASCPTGALGWANGKITLSHPERCNYCALCEEICPNGAIELPYLIRKQTPDETINLSTLDQPTRSSEETQTL
jgi:NAD-dependent dihydropyrimidine dehydrogenase PreA subunit